MRVLGVLGPPLRTVDRAATDATVARLAALALATGRTPLLPRVACDAPWVLREAGSFRGAGVTSGPSGSGFTLEVVAAACRHVYGDASDVADTCCYYLPMQVCVRVGGCVRDVKGKHTRVHSFFRPSCVQTTSLTNESEVSFPSDRRISALCAGGGAGCPKACLSFGPKNTALP